MTELIIQTAAIQPENKPLPPERLAPHSHEIEEAVLGAVLINADVLTTVRPIIAQAEEFFILKHQTIWEAMLTIADRGDTVDDLMVIDELEAQGKLDEIGGAAFITRLINNTPTYRHAESFAKVVQRNAIRRRLIAAASDIAQAAQDETLDLPAVLERTEQIIAGPIRAFREKENVTVSGKEVVKTALGQIVEWYANPQAIRGWRTGIGGLDRALGGIESGSLFLLFGHTGHGKSELLIQMMLSLLAQLGESDPKARALIVPTEMTKDQYMQRMIAFVAHTDTQTIKSGRYPDETYKNILKATNIIENLPHDFVGSRPTAEQLYSLCEARKRQGPTMLFVDGIHDLSVASAYRGSVYEEVTHTISQLQLLAQNLNIPVFCTAHINRDSKERLTREPILQDLLGSSKIEQAIAYALCLYRPGDFVQKGMMEDLPKGFNDIDDASVRIVKNRFGNNGSQVMLKFRHVGGVHGFYEQIQERPALPAPRANPSDKEPF